MKTDHLPADAIDAARYRWLRNRAHLAVIDAPLVFATDAWGESLDIVLDGNALDTAVDAAMRAEEGDE